MYNVFYKSKKTKLTCLLCFLKLINKKNHFILILKLTKVFISKAIQTNATLLGVEQEQEVEIEQCLSDPKQ